jgi:hypothetical protein
VRLALCVTLTAVLLSAGCAGKASRQGVAEVPQCRQAARTIEPSPFENRITLERMRADAYAECMQAHGYALDEDALEQRVLRKEQVLNGDPMGGDPALVLMRFRQEQRMNPELWRTAAK